MASSALPVIGDLSLNDDAQQYTGYCNVCD